MTVYGITAASSHYGTELFAELRQRGVPASAMVTLARDTSKLDYARNAGADVRHLDYRDLDVDSFATTLTGIDRLFIIPTSEVTGRVEQNAALIHAAEKAGVGHIFYLSFIGATEFPDNPLTPDHAATEVVLSESPIPTLSIRDGFYWDNYVSGLDGIKASGKLFSAAGDGVVSGASRVNYAEAGAALFVHPSPRTGVVTLGGVGLTKKEQAAVISDVFGIDIEYVELPVEELKKVWFKLGCRSRVRRCFRRWTWQPRVAHWKQTQLCWRNC